ncbi:NAD(P)-binding domain-containing protein [Allokutzneria sp. A3M-2-11 16]|uniref:NAD(P)-dependent oxidoreductase n=1 Tax=Allokutzneria sp. A3M-2-11 16 TaxID=2962043 RepID=UPI0020B81327|nr:NAD(P)-binding domain-containing protein [Allokutzneria sp. A3M-2-11 16]MCP3802251.1 NAD(P)-binding domain-containing protein [Allokutzneria sp. A3M-2-11 16]
MSDNNNRTDVTLVGLGSMGAELARAFIRAGHHTTVWNRTKEKGAALAVEGAVHELSIEDAVAASPLVITCLTTYEATLEALEPAVLEGRTLITLNSGTPSGARTMAAWAASRGADYLDGAVKNVPDAVGKPDTLLYYSGDKAVFDRYAETLRVLGGQTVHLGEEVDLAALYEYAVGGTLLPALLGFFQAAALVTGRGLPASSLVPYTVSWLEMIGSVLPSLAREIDAGDYGRPASSLGLFHEGIVYDEEMGREGGIDVSWHAPMHDLLRRAVAEGHAGDSISVLTELLRKPVAPPSPAPLG